MLYAKTTTIFALLVLIGVETLALPTFEPFADATAAGGTAYANGTALAHQTNAAGEGWARWNGGNPAFAVICTNTGLRYGHFPPDFPAPSNHAVYLPGQADLPGGAAGASAALNFSRAVAADPQNVSSNEIFASFLLNVPNLGNLTSGSPIYFAGLATNAGDQNLSLPASAMKIFLKGNSSTAGQSTTYSLGVANNSGAGSAAWDGGGHTSNDVLFVVVNYEFGVGGGPDVTRLWVHPDPPTFRAPLPPPVPSASTNILAATNKISRAADFFLLARSGKTLWGGLLVSDLRVGTNWSFVVHGAPRPTLSVATAGEKLVLTGGNGLAGETNFLLGNADVTLPLANWTRLQTNLSDPAGAVTFTYLSAATNRFYATQRLPGLRAANPDLWIPPCGAWLGAEVTNGSAANFSNHEARLGRPLDILRVYHPAGSWSGLTATEKTWINAGRKILISFKPDAHWSNTVGVAHGGSAAVDAQIVSAAKSVAAIKPRKIMLCIWHEPENDVIGTANGSAGTTSDYVAMWHNVRSLFDANGATNVIWVWSIQSYTPLRYLTAELWPGNAYVDWIGWDAYQGSASLDYVARQADCYNYLLTNSTPAHDYASKPWAWTEWGVGINGYFPTAEVQSNTFNAVNAALNRFAFPRVCYVAYFDNNNAPNGASAILSGAWGAYSNLANSPYFKQQWPP